MLTLLVWVCEWHSASCRISHFALRPIETSKEQQPERQYQYYIIFCCNALGRLRNAVYTVLSAYGVLVYTLVCTSTSTWRLWLRIFFWVAEARIVSLPYPLYPHPYTEYHI